MGMKANSVRIWISVLSVVILSGCADLQIQNPREIVVNEILPENFTIDIPDVISQPVPFVDGHLTEDIIQIEVIYDNIRGIVAAGEASTDVLNGFLDELRAANIDSAVSFSIISTIDGRRKDINISRGFLTPYHMTIDDEGGERAVEMSWGNEPPRVSGTIKPFNVDRSLDEALAETFYSFRYSDDDQDYDESVILSINNFPDSAGFTNMMMFAGRKGDIIDIFGNSYHPDIMLIDPSFVGGRNYVFTARVNRQQNVGFATLSLPPSAVDGIDEIYNDFSLFSVLEEELESVGNTDDEFTADYLMTATPPAFFVGDEGFVSSGANVPDNLAFSAAFLDLTPVVFISPITVRDLELSFDN